MSRKNNIISIFIYITICNAVSTGTSCGCLKDTNPVQTEHHNINNGYGCDHRQAFLWWHWTACLVICTLLEPLTLPKLYCTSWSTWPCSADVMLVRFYLWELWRGFPVNVITTPLVCLNRMSATRLYRNSTVLDRTSGTQQLHCWTSGETV
jgi:hypothetical protein